MAKNEVGDYSAYFRDVKIHTRVLDVKHIYERNGIKRRIFSGLRATHVLIVKVMFPLNVRQCYIARYNCHIIFQNYRERERRQN